MAEHWKSTPKYWCKHCSTYVKDTKFERTQHEATGKHQGSLKRFLRGIQNDHEKGERERQRAKSEVERLNRAVGGGSNVVAPMTAKYVTRPTVPDSSPATHMDQKRQIAQLAEMGVALPEECRGDLALPGEWRTVRQNLGEQGKPTKRKFSPSVGIHKQKVQGQEEEEGEEENKGTLRRKDWGSTTKDYPSDSKQNLDALLASTISVKPQSGPSSVKEDSNEYSTIVRSRYDATDAEEGIEVKKESSPERSSIIMRPADGAGELRSDLFESSKIIFKKRKSKVPRQK